ncbi:MAG: hypothetical protein WCX64_00415 [Candidatus Micrarchaeia archaeon]|jgi:hypothetical protein
MFFGRHGKRAQTSVEYMMAIAMTIVLVAAIMVTGFKELELDLSLSAARMGGTDFTAKSGNYTLGRIDFTINDTQNLVNVTPHFYLRGASSVSDADRAYASALCFLKMRSVFSPGEANLTADYCFDAPYRRYCVTPVMIPA